MEPTQPTTSIDEDVGEALAAAAMAIARRFANGSTMWCIAPDWPEHARHVAVEFVHPVLVGKRALPAVSLDTADPVASLRTLVRPHDVVLAIGPGDSRPIVDVMRRADAWGAMSVWIGVGARPPGRAAAHVIWLEHDGNGGERGSERSAVHDGRLVLLYHVLWELTHVCFEHPGLLAGELECIDEVCITCSDEGRVGEVVTAGRDGFARVRTARGIETIDTTVVADVSPGDLVLIHAGSAIAEVP